MISVGSSANQVGEILESGEEEIDDILGDKNHYPLLESWKHDWNLCDCTQMLLVIINHHWNIHKASD